MSDLAFAPLAAITDLFPHHNAQPFPTILRLTTASPTKVSVPGRQVRRMPSPRSERGGRLRVRVIASGPEEPAVHRRKLAGRR
jgi:hypothetical protein